MNKQQVNEKDLIGIMALLIHAAKIDDCYTQKEKKLIMDFAKSTSEDDDYLKSALIKAEELEANSPYKDEDEPIQDSTKKEPTQDSNVKYYIIITFHDVQVICILYMQFGFNLILI